MNSFSESANTGSEKRPVFGVRELEESDFIFNAESVQQHQKETVVQNQKISVDPRNITQNNTPDCHSSGTQGTTMGQNASPQNDAFLSLPEIPKGTLISS